jgi:hypothetical protein
MATMHGNNVPAVGHRATIGTVDGLVFMMIVSGPVIGILQYLPRPRTLAPTNSQRLRMRRILACAGGTFHPGEFETQIGYVTLHQYHEVYHTLGRKQ